MGFDGLTRPLGRLRRLPPLVVDAGLGAIFVVLVAVEVVRQPVAGGGDGAARGPDPGPGGLPGAAAQDRRWPRS